MLTILLAMLEDEEDQRKFLKLHTAYEQKLYRIALKILRSHELAEDAVQQSWVQVIQHFEKVKQVPWGAVDGYLVVIVKNVSMTMLRKENHTDPLPEDWDAPAPSAPEMDETGRIVELIRSMPERYREVFRIKEILLAHGALNAAMSGSGPTVYGIFESAAEAQRAAEVLKKSYQQTYVAKPVKKLV